MTVFRGGERIEVTLTLTERDPSPGAQAATPSESESMGLAVAPVPELVRRNLGLSEGQAIIVQAVEPGSPAADAGVMPGDVILSASNEGIGSGEELSSAWAAAREAARPLLLRINRNGSPLFLAVEAERTDSPQD